jgi:hypothetical protein
MKRELTTFDLCKILRINRNTLQSALAGNFIIPDIERAEGVGERSLFSIKGAYRVNLFFHMVRAGRPRRKAQEESAVSFENVGTKKGQRHYCVFAQDTRPEAPTLKGAGEWKFYESLPAHLEGKTICWAIDLAAIKKQVDDGIAEL